ncbi:hypothetical protein [Parendozoicomonas sp. Alg238-R29]|uniref:hypothetical protein n=1 Tax=Parendozoicomonas sp. Alg238-R29 TaxID=2993446 RepID=UPI00248EA3B8|nr:hypothetical protein [Parendozoicomonas sp. Alg238-R29]
MAFRLSGAVFSFVMAAGIAFPAVATENSHTTQNFHPSQNHEINTKILGFEVVLNASGKSWSGQVIMAHEQWLNGSSLRLSSHFSNTPPEGLRLPEYEDLQEDGGMVFTRVSSSSKPKSDSEELVRVTEYGTFAHMGDMVGKLPLFPEGRKTVNANRLYLSHFLLLDEPAFIKEIYASHTGSGYKYDLTMSDSSHITYRLSNQQELQGITIERLNKTLTYRVAPSVDMRVATQP